MRKYYLLANHELPIGFKYPKSFLNIVDNIEKIPELEPYFFLVNLPQYKLLSTWNKTIKKQYPKRVLIPFAKDGGSDDVFCFDGTDTSGNPKVYQVHTFASEGWEDRGYWDSFDDWYEDIKQISQEFKEEMEEDE